MQLKLNDLQIKNAKPRDKQYKLSDGEQMYLLIRTSGAKLWQMSYKFHGKWKTYSIGEYPKVSLSEARKSKEAAKELLRKGVDPSEDKKQKEAEKKKKVNEERLAAQGIHVLTEDCFEPIAREWLKKRKGTITQRHINTITNRLEVHVFPDLGHRHITEIEPAEILEVLQKIEDRGTIDTTHRIKQYISQIFRYAIARSKAKFDPIPSLQGAIKTVKPKHNNSLTEDDLPEFLHKLEHYDSLDAGSDAKGDLQTKLGLKLVVLTFVRTNEIRGSRWPEFKLDKQEWHIPPERMKMKEKHIVPLPRQAIEVLKQLKQISGESDLCFPSRLDIEKPISENTLLYAMYRMGYRNKATVHGFRATASTILNENGFNSDHIERQLAHAPRDAVRAAYNYAQYLPERHKMMQWWADFLDEQAKKKK